MRRFLIPMVIGAVLAGCALDSAGPTGRPSALREVAAAQPSAGSGPVMGRVLRSPSPEERALMERLLTRVPAGEARAAMRQTLEGTPGFLVQVRSVGDPQMQAMLDSLAALRGYGRSAAARKKSIVARTVRIQ